MKIWIKVLTLFAFSLSAHGAEDLSLPSDPVEEKESFLRDYSLWNLKPRDTLDRSLHPLNERRSAHSILLITLPRSGTNFLIGSLSYGLTTTKEWCGRFIGTPEASGTIEPALLEDLLFFGGVSWCHAKASPENVALLESYGLPVTIQMRDPRQAVLSFLYHIKSPLSGKEIEKEEEHLPPANYPFSEEEVDDFIAFWFPKFISWIESWVRYAKAHPGKVQILFYEDMCEDLSSHLEKILRFQGIRPEEFDNSIEEIRKFWEKNNLLHFRKGKKDEWKTFFTPRQIEYLNSLMSGKVFKFLPFERCL